MLCENCRYWYSTLHFKYYYNDHGFLIARKLCLYCYNL